MAMDIKGTATAKASVFDVGGVNINLGDSDASDGHIAGLIRLLAPVARAKKEAKARDVAVDSYISTVRKLQEAFPVMSDRRAAMEALGYKVTNEQADNVAAVLESAAGSLDAAGVEPRPLLPEARDAIVEGAAKAYDDDLRALWARILVGELDEPGSHSKPLLGLLASIDSTQALTFSKLCSYVLVSYVPGAMGEHGKADRVLLLVSDKDGGTFNGGSLTLLERGICGALGLVETGLLARRIFSPSTGRVYQVGDRLILPINHTDADVTCTFGSGVLLPLGEELSSLCQCGNAPNLPELAEKHFRDAGLDVEWSTKEEFFA